MLLLIMALGQTAVDTILYGRTQRYAQSKPRFVQEKQITRQRICNLLTLANVSRGEATVLETNDQLFCSWSQSGKESSSALKFNMLKNALISDLKNIFEIKPETLTIVLKRKPTAYLSCRSYQQQSKITFILDNTSYKEIRGEKHALITIDEQDFDWPSALMYIADKHKFKRRKNLADGTS